MNQRWNRRAVLALVLVAIMVAPFGQLGRVAGAQEATPAGEEHGTSALGAPMRLPFPGRKPGTCWSTTSAPKARTGASTPSTPTNLQAHPGDTIVFTLAPNPQAFHTVQILTAWRLARTPLEFYQGYLGGFRQPDPTRPGEWQSPYFGVVDPRVPCGRVGQDPCLMPFFPEGRFGLGINSGVLVNPPPDGGEGNPSFTVTLDPALTPGPYYVLSLVDGPTMSGLIDIVAPDQPVQSQEALDAAAELQYQADLVVLAGLDGVSGPSEASNPDGTKTWQVAAGRSDPDQPWLSINAVCPGEDGDPRR